MQIYQLTGTEWWELYLLDYVVAIRQNFETKFYWEKKIEKKKANLYLSEYYERD
jgi:hypothetical protein